MAVTVTIAGVTSFMSRGSVTISLQDNGRGTATFGIRSLDGTLRPAMDSEVVIRENGTAIFGGLIDRPTEQGFVAGFSPAIITRVNAVDYSAYADRRYVKLDIAAGSLKAALQALEPYLTGYGVVLDPGQVTGPTLPALSYNYRQLSDILNELGTLTSSAGEPFAWTISPLKIFGMYQRSLTAAPFNILNDTPANVVGDVEVEYSRNDYANRVIVVVKPDSQVGRIESFTGDGVTSTFSLQYTLTRQYGIINVYESDGVTPAGGETFGIPPSSPIQWSYDTVTNSITRTIGPTDATKVYKLTFDGTFNGLGLAEDAGQIASVGIWEKVISVDTVPTNTTAQALADAYLAKSLPTATTVRYLTDSPALLPGQTQTITLPKRNISGQAVISEVVITDIGAADENLTLRRSVIGVLDNSKTNLGKGWRDIYKLWAGDKVGNSAPAPVTAPVVAATGPGGDDTNVQYNDNGVFGGQSQFTYDKTTHCLVVGDQSLVSATGAESCQIFGYNCEIANP